MWHENGENNVLEQVVFVLDDDVSLERLCVARVNRWTS
jgi:hypothetical protein